MLNRRAFTAALLPAPAIVLAQEDPAAALLRKGGVAIVIRHAQTVPGVGDPEGFRIDLCSTQRNLSQEGRAQARQIGAWFKAHGLQPRAVQTSAWCRCKDTADLAFGRHLVWPALNSFFGGRSNEPRQTAMLKEALKDIAPGRFEVWVTHQVNMTALTGGNAAQGEGLIVDAGGRIAGRTTFP